MRRRLFIQHTAHAAAGFAVFHYLGGCRAGSAPTGRFAELRDRYFVRTLELNPVTSTYLGGDGYTAALASANGRLRDYQPEALVDEARFYRETRSALDRLDPAGLTEAERIDRAVLLAQLEFLLHQNERRYHQRAVDTYVAEPFRGVDWQIQQMKDEGNGLLGSEDEWRLVVTRLEAVPRYYAAALANLKAGRTDGVLPDHRMVRRDGLEGSRANAEYFSATLPQTAARLLGGRSFAAGTRTAVERAGRAAATACTEFADTLGALYDANDSTDRFATGAEEYDWRLRHCLRLPQTPGQLYEYGAEQVRHYQERMFEVAQELARRSGVAARFGTAEERHAGVRAVLDYLSQDAPANDDELFRWYREAGERAVAYGREQRLFDVPADYRLDILPTPPVLRSTIDAAYYPAPPFKSAGVGRFYLTPTGNDPASLKQNNRSSVADTTVHEGFPGHDWHYKYMTQHAREISHVRWLTPGAVEDSSAMWEDSMASEGWALYAEELMAEPAPGKPHGFYTAAEHLYELQGQLLRAVRVRVDTGLHTGRMSFEAAKDYFTENVDFLPSACARAARDPAARAACDSADRAIYRYSKWPTQAITYHMGRRAIEGLRDETRRRQGERFSAQRFHERLMRMGTIPAGYFRDVFLSSAS